MSKTRRKKRPPKRVLTLPDLEQSKAAVLNSLTSKSGQRTYFRSTERSFSATESFSNRSAMRQRRSTFGALPCGESLSKQRIPACSVPNWPLACDVKSVRRIGVRLGNWLTAEQGKRLLANVERGSLRGTRNYAILAVLIGCGLRRGELLAIRFNHARSAGLSLTCGARLVTPERFPYRLG